MIQTTDITDKALIDSYQKQAITLNTQNELTTDSSYPFVSHKFLVSEIVKMNGQESVNSYSENTKKWGKNK